MLLYLARYHEDAGDGYDQPQEDHPPNELAHLSFAVMELWSSSTGPAQALQHIGVLASLIDLGSASRSKIRAIDAFLFYT